MLNNMALTHDMHSPIRDPYVHYNSKPKFSSNDNGLTLQLLEEVLDNCNLAKMCHKCESFVEKGFHLGQMNTTLDQLREQLYSSRELFVEYDLKELYDYAEQSIKEAVFENDTYYLDCATNILLELKDDWIRFMNDYK